jgi:hypothetical protein
MNTWVEFDVRARLRERERAALERVSSSDRPVEGTFSIPSLVSGCALSSRRTARRTPVATREIGVSS